jgi:serine-type D-Ala-D-Ala endopeptidase (penicillin-binding protein 7)
MKKVYFIIIALFLTSLPAFVFASQTATTSTPLKNKYAGQILLQVESYGRAWFVNPADKARYYLGNSEQALAAFKSLTEKIADKDLQKIPQTKKQPANLKTTNKYKGKILTSIENAKETWYVNPLDGLRYQLKDASTTMAIIKKFAQGVSNAQLRQIPMNTKQLAFDSAFDDIAYASLSDGKYLKSYYGSTILPLASLTKLMTALVFLDTEPNWQKTVTITQAQIDYPKYYAGNDQTSEIEMAAGDQLTIEDLWVALLVASSNQAAAILADASGLDRMEFIKKMNQKAKDLGLSKTKFVDVSGLDPNNISTVKEYARVAETAFSQTKILTTSKITDYSISANDANGEVKTILVKNRNSSLLAFQPDASKTGYLVEAQRNVVFLKNNRIIAVFHAHSNKERDKIIKNLLK